MGDIIPFAQPPYYANSDDQTQLNDAIISAVLGNLTFLSSIGHYEAKHKYNSKGMAWDSLPESKALRDQLGKMYRRQRGRSIR